MWKASTTSQWPSVGETLAWVNRQGQSSSQLQDSKYSPSIFQLSLAIDDRSRNRSRSWFAQRASAVRLRAVMEDETRAEARSLLQPYRAFKGCEQSSKNSRKNWP